MKGKLLLALGITLVLEVFLFLVLLLTPTYCGACAITDKPCPPCPNTLDSGLPFILYSAVPLFIVIFLILHSISKYKK